MSLREKEKAKEQQDKYQAILSALLKDEDNKYCVDCDAKGPRWASWNLGIFLCIRCAGIHRNLGVHISRVKSVNLDTWTAEQVAMMQEIGNSRARAVYEANIPDGFRRPQSDSALEAFIRSKYEQKKYIAREWVPPTPKVPKEFVSDEWLEDSKNEKKKARAKPASGQIQLGGIAPKAVNKPNVGAPAGEPAARPAQPAKTEVKLPATTKPAPAPAAPSSAANDLLGLDLSSHTTPQAVAPTAPSSGNELLDLFGGPQPGSSTNGVAQSTNNDLMNGSSSEGNLFEGDGPKEEKKTSTKDSIMALFGGTGGGGGGAQAPQQMYNIPASTATFAQNGMAVSQMGPTTATMPGAVSNSFTPSMMSSPQTMPAPYSAQQMMMYGAVDQSKQSQSHMFSMTSQPQQQLNTSATPSMLPSNPKSVGLNQQPTSSLASAQAQNLFNLTSPVSQNFNTGGGQMQSLLPTSLAGQSLQPSVTGPASSTSNHAKAPSASTPAFGQRPPNPMYFGQNQPCYYGGMYMPQGQQAFGGMMPQQQNMMGQPPNMMGYQPNNMMGQQPQGMMGANAMNGSQMGMYNNQMMPGAQGAMYTPQQMQQLQFQQMQQQMAAMNMGGHQQMQGGWGGNPSTGQTLSNNLWQ